MILASAASALGFADSDNGTHAISLWTTVAIGAVALVSSYSLGVKEGKKTKESDAQAQPMVCPFSGKASTKANQNTKSTTKTPCLKTYKFDLSPEHKSTIKATLPLVAQCGTKFTEHFYKRLFAGMLLLFRGDELV